MNPETTISPSNAANASPVPAARPLAGKVAFALILVDRDEGGREAIESAIREITIPIIGSTVTPVVVRLARSRA